MKKILLIIMLLPLLSAGQSIHFQNNKVEMTSIGVLNVDSSITTGTTAANYVSIDSKNSVRMYGSSTVFDDLMFPFTTGFQGINPYPTFNADSIYYNWVIDTVGASKCMMYFIIQMPHTYKEGTTIYPHVHYKYETAVGTPTFRMKYKWYDSPESGNTNVAYNWYSMSNTTGTTNNTIQMCYNGGISGVNKTISSILICELYLVAQTGTGDVHAYQFDIHFEKDAVGSNTITSKN